MPHNPTIVSEGTKTSTVRAAHRFDEDRLAGVVREHLPDATGKLTVEQFGYGQSNPTYLLRWPNAEFVLRKQPPGELLPSAHAVDREFRVQKALEGTGVPVAKMHFFSDDRSIVGTPFYVMERKVGRVFTDCALPGTERDERAPMYRAVAETLAKLHTVDPAAVGLDDFGRPGSYYERQFNRWSRNYLQTKTREIPEMDRLMEWLPPHLPPGDETTIVHGDFRIGNIMFHPTEPRVVAVFDWELSEPGRVRPHLRRGRRAQRLDARRAPDLLDVPLRRDPRRRPGARPRRECGGRRRRGGRPARTHHGAARLATRRKVLTVTAPAGAPRPPPAGRPAPPAPRLRPMPGRPRSRP